MKKQLFLSFSITISLFQGIGEAGERPIPSDLTAVEEAEYAKLQCGAEPIGFWATNKEFYEGATQIYANEALKDVSSVYRICNMSTDHPMDVMTSSGKTYTTSPFTCLDVRFKKYISVGGHIAKDSNKERPEIHGHYCQINTTRALSRN